MSDHIKPPYDVALPKITPEVYEAYGGNVHLIRPDNNDWSVVAVDFAVEIVRPAVQDRIDTLESQRAQAAALLNAGAGRINTLEAALREHGRHKQHCALLDYHDERAVDCTCGLSAALAGEPK
jgi:hypothetical protein